MSTAASPRGSMSPKMRRLWHAHARAYRRWVRRGIAHPLYWQAERLFRRLDKRLAKLIATEPR